MDRRVEYLREQRDALVAAGAPEQDVETVEEALSEAEGNSLLGDGSPRPNP